MSGDGKSPHMGAGTPLPSRGQAQVGEGPASPAALWPGTRSSKAPLFPSDDG